MELADLLTAEDIAFGIQEGDIAAAAARLLRTTLPRRGFVPAEVERLVAAVVARERETPTLCGAIAIPHARDANLKDFVLAVAVNPAGIVAAPAAPRVLIAFLSPEPRRSEHLDLLARLARLSRDNAAVSAIAAATDAKGVLEIIRERPR